MATNGGWGRPASPPPWCEQRLSTHDCDPTIGELVLRGDVARLFAPGGGDCAFDYNPTLQFLDGGQAVVRVSRSAAGRQTLLGEGWREICQDFDLMPGDDAVFAKPLPEDRTFVIASFRDGDGNHRHRRLDDAPDSPPSPEFQVNADWLRARGAEAARGWQDAGAGGGGGGVGGRALQGDDDMTIREAMDLAVECGAREGSDEHYMATKLFVKAENRAMFLTFRTNAGRLQWLRRCYQDRMN